MPPMTEEAAATGLPFNADALLRAVKSNGWSIVLAVLFVAGALGFIPKVYTQLADIMTGVGQIQGEHKTIGEKFGNLQMSVEEGNRIACAQCWNDAKSEDEIKR